MAYSVSTCKAADYSPEQMDAAVAWHFASLDVGRLIPVNAKVVLKPNLLMKRTPYEATTTHPALVAAVVRGLQSLGITDITIADSPGGPFTRSALEGIYTATGMVQVAQQTGAKLNYDTTYKSVTCCTLDGLCRTYNIISVVEQADCIINLPKLKTHAMTTLSGATKNLFGCIPGLQKPELHFRFPEMDKFSRMLVELSQTVRPHLSIVDGVVSMEGDGPSSGVARKTGWTLASTHVGALDMALCQLISLPPEKVPTLANAMAMGIAPQSTDELEYLGEKPQPLSDYRLPASYQESFGEIRQLPKPLRSVASGVLNRLLTPRPVVHRSDCIGCGKCAESCPAHCIAIAGRKASIDRKDCIKCFCCHEMCPVKAIGIRRLKLLDL